MKILMLLFFTSLAAWSDGQEIGSAGGFSLCRDGRYYSYDFIMKVPNPFGPSKSGQNLNQRIQFISHHLKRLKEPLVASFDLFVSLLFTQKSGARYVWFPTGELPLMWQPGEEKYLPQECNKRKQAVIFFEINLGGGKMRGDYRYDFKLFKQVESQPEGNLQLSYLLVHEWLWTYFEQTQFVNSAIFNRLLQSEKLGTMTEQEYHLARKQYLKIRDPAKKPSWQSPVFKL